MTSLEVQCVIACLLSGAAHVPGALFPLLVLVIGQNTLFVYNERSFCVELSMLSGTSQGSVPFFQPQ